MTSTQSFKIVRMLKETFQVSDKQAEQAVQGIETIIDERFNERSSQLATKTDLAEVKFDILKWVVVISAAQTGTILGFLYFILRKP